MPRGLSTLFSPDGPSVFTIPPGADFLTSMACGLYDEQTRLDAPDWLGSALIYMPNRRSARGLSQALFEQGGGAAQLLPDIRVLGDLETETGLSGLAAGAADLPPAISPAERLGTLTQLILAYSDRIGAPMPPQSALAAARSLADLIDQADLSEGATLDQLDHLVKEADFADHWHKSLRFLKIITEAWPDRLEELDALNPYARRRKAAEAIGKAWQDDPPAGPVIIAGSTGATPASRVLMQAACALKEGLIILPGFDRAMPESVWGNLPNSPSHPQFALARTVKALGLAPESVQIWPDLTLTPNLAKRQSLIQEALAPALDTADWTVRLSSLAGGNNTGDYVASALENLTLLNVADETEEAEIAALLLREALERPEASIALVTPSTSLGYHVATLLKRWEIEVSPSAGRPLLQMPAGQFVGLIADWLVELGDPARLLAVLRHPSCRFDTVSVECLDRVLLRGVRTWRDLTDLRQHLHDLKALADSNRNKIAKKDSELCETLLAEILQTLADIEAIDEADLPLKGARWYKTVIDLATALSLPPAPWSGEDGRALSLLFEDLASIASVLGPQAGSVWFSLFEDTARQVSVAGPSSHPQIAIWGPLEARLQSADHIVLAGLNEGIWPAQPAADPFLPRRFRKDLGLPDPDERIGLSAHDFAQLASAPRVTLLSAERRDDQPTVASRWLWRLRMLAEGALGRDEAKKAFAPPADEDPRAWRAILEAVPEAGPHPPVMPAPKPPRAARPKGLSVTRIEALIRDPYAIYCQYVLGLYPLDPLNLPVDVRVRGTAIHTALETFETETNDGSAESLMSYVEDSLRSGGESELDLIALRGRRLSAVESYIAWRGETAADLKQAPLTEEKGAIEIMIAGEPFQLSGTADRIEVRQDGQLAILDFKSGKPPTEAQVRSGLAPQMPLQGLIAQRGGYPPLPGVQNVSALTYLQLGTSFMVQEIGAPGGRNPKAVGDIISEAEAGLVSLLTQFADETHPFLSAPVPDRVKYQYDYDQLARRAEWSGQGGDD